MRKKNIVVVMIFIMAIFMVGCNNSQNDSSVNENIQQESVEERTFSDEESVERFKYYISKEPQDVQVEMCDVLATVYLAAFVSDEAWVYSSDYDQYVTEYGGTQGFCFPDIGWKAEPF